MDARLEKPAASARRAHSSTCSPVAPRTLFGMPMPISTVVLLVVPGRYCAEPPRARPDSTARLRQGAAGEAAGPVGLVGEDVGEHARIAGHDLLHDVRGGVEQAHPHE